MNQFVMAEVPPGTYTVETAMARNGIKPSNSETTLSVQGGDVVVILAMLKVQSLHSTTTQERIVGTEAQTAVATTKMIEWTNRSASVA
jgi:aspartate 1-decarboxylase